MATTTGKTDFPVSIELCEAWNGDWVLDHPTVTLAAVPPGSVHATVPVLGPDFEILWLPVLGPSAVVVARHLARIVTDPHNVNPAADWVDVSHRCGIPTGKLTRSTPIVRTIVRLARFGMLSATRDDTLHVPLHVVPPKGY